MDYGLDMLFSPRLHSGYLLGILGILAIFAGGGCGKKDAPPAPEPATKEAPKDAPKEAPAGTKPAANEMSAPTAAVAPAPESTEMAAPKPASSANANDGAATATAPTQAANVNAAPTETAAATNPAQPAPTPIETVVPTVAATPTAPEAPPPPPVESPKQTGQAFSVWLQSSGKYTAGQQGAVEAVVMPKGEFHCNQEYPYKFVTSSLSSGVTFPKSTYRAEGLTLSPNRAVMRIPFVPQSAGEARVGGTFHFSVCTDQQCVVEKRDVFVTVKVQ